MPIATASSKEQAKMSRTWTTSRHVKHIFEYIDSQVYPCALFTGSSNRLTSNTLSALKETGIGYANPKDGFFTDNVFSSLPNGRGWDARFCTAFGNKEFKTNGSIDSSLSMTDYAETIIITEDPFYIDLLIRVGEIGFPVFDSIKSEDAFEDNDMVFLVLHPDFVSKHEKISQIVEQAISDGQAIDTRPYLESGVLERKIETLDKYGFVVTNNVTWHGCAPFEAAIPTIKEKLLEVGNIVKGNIIWGIDPFDPYPWEPDWDDDDDVAVGKLAQSAFMIDALMMERDWLDFPVDKIHTGRAADNKEENDTWEELCSQRSLEIISDSIDPAAKEIINKLDEAYKVAQIWVSMNKKYRVSLHFSERELERRHEFVFSRIKELGRMLGIDECIESLRDGVPLEDIIA